MFSSMIDNQIWEILVSDDALKDELAELAEMGGLIWQRGWAEANAGNVSIMLPDSFHQTTFQSIRQVCKEIDVSELRDNIHYTWFLVSASGSRYREYAVKGFQCFVLLGIETEQIINDKVITYSVFPSDRKPTSEISSHIKMHTYLVRHRPSERVILHAHSTDWIALSGSVDYRKDDFHLNKALFESLPEMQFYFPHGIVFSKYATPGSEQLARITESAIEKSNIIIWERHGVVISADNIMQAYDYLEILSKAASVYIQQRSANLIVRP